MVSIGRPYQVEGGVWQCEIRAAGFLTTPQMIYGGGPVDTLINALEVLKAVRDKSTYWVDGDAG